MREGIGGDNETIVRSSCRTGPRPPCRAPTAGGWQCLPLLTESPQVPLPPLLRCYTFTASHCLLQRLLLPSPRSKTQSDSVESTVACCSGCSGPGPKQQ